MPEGKLHKVLKRKFAGKTGETEIRLRSGRTVDSQSGTGIVTEVELDGKPRIRAAVSRAKEAQNTGVARKIRLVVQPGKEDTAVREMRRQRIRGTVQSTDGTIKAYVSKRRRSTKY